MMSSMPATVEQFRADLLALPEADRAELASLLIESLGQPRSEMEKRDFEEELARRADAIRSGRAIGISSEELFARIDARLARPGR